MKRRHLVDIDNLKKEELNNKRAKFSIEKTNKNEENNEEKKCRACGGIDHVRTSSKKCLKYKPPIRGDDNTNFSIVSRKCALQTIIRKDSGFFDAIVELFEKDAIDFSQFEYELSLLYHYFISYYARIVCKYDNEKFLELFPKCNVSAFDLYLKNRDSDNESDLERKLKKIHDPNRVLERYEALKISQLRKISWKLRSASIQNIMNEYETRLETNIKTHVLSRLKRYAEHIMFKGDDFSKTEIRDLCNINYYGNNTMDDKNKYGDIKNHKITKWFSEHKITAKTMKKDWWQYGFLFMIKIRDELSLLNEEEGNSSSFIVMPQYSATKIRNHFYDTKCIYEFLRRIDPTHVPGRWSKLTDPRKELWEKYFNCDFLSTTTIKFGSSLQTDGISVSLSMNKSLKLNSNKNEELPTYEEISKRECIAVYPGAIEPLVTYSSKTRTSKRLRARRVKFEYRELRREEKRKKIMDKLEEEIRHERENLKIDISPKSYRFEDYVKFQLSQYPKIQSIIKNRTLRRLRFDAFICKQKFTEKIIKEFFPISNDDNNQLPLILYGKGYQFMNKINFKCKQHKYSHKNLLHLLRSKGYKIFEIDEYLTTKVCCKCLEDKVKDKIENQEVVLSSRKLLSETSRTVFNNKNCNKVKNENVTNNDVVDVKHRYVRCPTCRTGAHRDVNGAKNIFTKFMYESFICNNNNNNGAVSLFKKKFVTAS